MLAEGNCGECECEVLQVPDLSLHNSETMKSVTPQRDWARIPGSRCEDPQVTGRTCDSARNCNQKLLCACDFSIAHRRHRRNCGEICIADLSRVIR